MKHYLITGASGFIGQSYVKSLASANVKITLLSREKSLEKTKKIFPTLNVLSFDLEKGVFSDLNMDSLSSVTDVVHIAGGYDIGMNFKEAYENNILVAQNIIHLIKKLKTAPLVHLVSSFSVVGNSNNQNYSEDDLCLNEKKMSSYSFSKAKVEEAFRLFSEKEGIKLRVYRPGIVIETRDNQLMPKIDGHLLLLKSSFETKSDDKTDAFFSLTILKRCYFTLSLY